MEKIKVAISDSDKNYLDKLVSAFTRRYPDDIAFSLFTTSAAALAALRKSSYDLFLFNSTMDICPDDIPSGCLYALLSDIPVPDAGNNNAIIFKYQRIDILHENILQVIQEGTAKPKSKIIQFCGAGGGVGTSCTAAACSIQLAKKNKVAYINLECFGSADLYFSENVHNGWNALIHTLRNSKNDFRAQVQNNISADSRGVIIYANTNATPDMVQLETEDILWLITELKNAEAYEYIILDLPFSPGSTMVPVYRLVDSVVLVSDGSLRSESKAERMMDALEALHKSASTPVANQIYRIYNHADDISKFHSRIPVLGVIHTYQTEAADEVSNEHSIVEKLAALDFFSILI